jgi:uncharacterized membrane protein
VIACLTQLGFADVLGSIGPYFRFTGVFHPAVAHFPIALLMVAALVESYSVLRRQRKPQPTTLICLYLGGAAAVGARVLGWARADVLREHSQLANLHRWLGIAVAVLAVGAIVITIINRRRESGGLVWAYRGGLFTAAALVGLVGSFGGKLVHGEDYYTDAIASLQNELNTSSENAAKYAVVSTRDSAKSANANVNDTAAKVSDAVTNTASASPTTPAAPVLVAVPSAAPAHPAAADVPPPSVAAAPGFSGGQIDFSRDIAPIFEARCVKCHSETKKKGGYRLDTREHVFAAGESGKVPVLPGKSDESMLVKMIEGKGEFEDSKMPPTGTPLTFQEIALIRRWIDEGAQSSTTP